MKAFLKLLCIGALFGVASTFSAQAGTIKCPGDTECRCERIDTRTMTPLESRFWFDNCATFGSSGLTRTSYTPPEVTEPDTCGKHDWKKKKNWKKHWKKHGEKDWQKRPHDKKKFKKFKGKKHAQNGGHDKRKSFKKPGKKQDFSRGKGKKPSYGKSKGKRDMSRGYSGKKNSFGKGNKKKQAGQKRPDTQHGSFGTRGPSRR